MPGGRICIPSAVAEAITAGAGLGRAVPAVSVYLARMRWAQLLKAGDFDKKGTRGK